MKTGKEWPAALRNRWFLHIAAGVGFLLVGLAAFSALHDRMLLMISALLSLCTVLRCLSFYRMVQAESYEVVEGVCIELGRPGLRKRRRVRLLQEDGNEYAVLLDKRTPLRIGNRYRIYFRREDDGGQDVNLFPCFAAEGQFLGLEDMGEYHAAASSKSDKENTRSA